MTIAATSASDGIAIVVVATVLFLIGLGILGLLKFLFRLILGKPRAVEPQSVCVSFERVDGWLGEGAVQEFKQFSAYLETRVRSGKLGGFDGGEFEKEGVRIYFHGPDAERIWERIEADVRAYAPARPVEVRFDLGKKRGGRKVVGIAEDGPRHPEDLPDFEIPEPATGISLAWTVAGRIATCLWLSSMAGLFLSWFFQKVTGTSEREMMQSGIGSFVAFTLSGMFVVGMVLALVCVSHSERVDKRAHPGPMGRARRGPVLPRWISNKVILAIVAAVIVGLAMALRME